MSAQARARNERSVGDGRSANVRSSVPLKNIWAPKSVSAERSAERRSASRCAATSSRRTMGGGAPCCSRTRRTCARRMLRRSAFCSPVEESSAGRSLCACDTLRSLLCGPTRFLPATASRARFRSRDSRRRPFGRRFAHRREIGLDRSVEAQGGAREKRVGPRAAGRQLNRSEPATRASARRQLRPPRLLQSPRGFATIRRRAIPP